MSDGITDSARSEERLSKIDPQVHAARACELKPLVNEYNRIVSDLKSMGFMVQEFHESIRVWQELELVR